MAWRAGCGAAGLDSASADGREDTGAEDRFVVEERARAAWSRRQRYAVQLHKVSINLHNLRLPQSLISSWERPAKAASFIRSVGGT